MRAAIAIVALALAGIAIVGATSGLTDADAHERAVAGWHAAYDPPPVVDTGKLERDIGAREGVAQYGGRVTCLQGGGLRPTCVISGGQSATRLVQVTCDSAIRCTWTDERTE